MSESTAETYVYLDYAGACPVRPEVADLHVSLCGTFRANPHGTSRFSNDAKTALWRAERRILGCLGIPEGEAGVVWTSGGTEADNLITQGVLKAHPDSVCLVDAAAHHALLEPCQQSEMGTTYQSIPLRGDGTLDLDRLDPDLAQRASLVAVCHVNNETGAVHDLPTLRRWMAVHTPRALLAVDAVQSFGKIAIPWSTARIDLVALSARKIGGPGSTGAAIIRNGVKLRPIMVGGGQQGGVRPGTVDVVGVIEMTHAAQAACAEMPAEHERLARLNHHLRQHCTDSVDPRLMVLSPGTSVPNILTVAVPGYEGAVLMRLLAERNILVATGSACTAESGGTSHVLRAMGVDEPLARSVLRVSFGYGTTTEDVETFIQGLQAVVHEY